MARKVGSIYAEIIAKLDKFEKGLNEAHRISQRSATKIQSSLDRINFDKAGAAVSSFHTKIIGLASTIGAVRLANSFIDTASAFEQMGAKLEVIVGSRAPKILEELNALALELPVSTREMTASFVKMTAMGLEPTKREMLILADVAAVLGDDVFDRIVTQLSQMSAKGKVMAQDLNILAEAGIRARAYLQDAFGMTVEELQDSNVEIHKVVQAIFSGMERDFEGSSAKMLNTWRGITEVSVSLWTEFQRKIADAGAFEALKSIIMDLNKQFEAWYKNNEALIKQKVPEFAEKTKVAIQGLVGQFDNLYKILTYDPAIIEYGLIGLLLGGKKGFALAGGIAHLAKIPAMLGEATALAAKGYINYSDIVKADYKELEALIERARGLQSKFASGWEPDKRVSLGVSHMTTVGTRQQTTAVQNNLDNLTKYVDGWRSRWDADWSKWGVKTPIYAAVKTDTEASKKALKELERSQQEVINAVADAQRKVWEMSAASLDQNTEADRFRRQSQYIPDINRIKAEWEKIPEIVRDTYGEIGDIHQRHKIEMSGPADPETVKKNLEEISETYKEKASAWTELSQRTAEAIEQNFSDLLFDAMTGKLDSLSDYFEAFFTSVQRMSADILGQIIKEWAFPQGGGANIFGKAGDLFGSLFSSGAGAIGGGGGAAMDATTALALVKHSGGGSGASAAMRRIPASAFSFAPRLHNGLAADEYPAILQRGETVQRKGSSPSNNITININSPNGRVDRHSLQQIETKLIGAMARAATRSK